ncbi:hypothetical protein EON65_36555 [archaeon]|nr:MAG: hypothetical protein EON65_36555 [archaeon]
MVICELYDVIQDAQNPELTEEDIELGWCLMPVGGNNAAASPLTGYQKSIAQCYLSTYKFWIHYCYRGMCKLGSIVLGLGSCLILWSEMLMASKLQSPIGFLMGAYDLDLAEPVIVQAVAFLVLAYMSICTYWTLFRLNIGWSYRLQGPQLSPPSSLIFNGEYLSRLQFALGYNFLLCINVSRSGQTAFRQLMQNIEIIPVFGTSFTVYVPILMTIIALITFFDGLPRMLAFLGVDSEESVYGAGNCLSCWPNKVSGNEMDAGLLEKYNSGKQVVANELRQAAQRQENFNRSRTVLNSKSTSQENMNSTALGTNPIVMKESVVRSPFLSSLSDKMSKPKYSNLEMGSPPSGLAEDDDDELSTSIYNTSAWSAGRNNQVQEARKPVNVPSSSVFGSKAAAKTVSNVNNKPVNPPPRTSNHFSFLEDDDEDQSAYRGRYSDL